MAEKVVLAYSGGLDTSVILHWLCEKGFEVVAFIADLGQKEDIEEARERALKIGASKVYVEDLREEFVVDFIFPAIRAGAVYEGRYLMGTSLARPLIAKKQVEIAEKEGASIVAHGATGKGNDQVRFELSYRSLAPHLKIIAPWRDPEFLKMFKGRRDLLRYAAARGIPLKTTEDKPWSIDANLMHVSYEGGELEDPAFRPKEEMFQMTLSPARAPDRETELVIEFERGNPVKVICPSEGRVEEKPLELFLYLNELGGRNGIGREDLVENRFVGMKSRGVYETPAGTILHKAHRDLEGLTLDRELMRLKDMLSPKFAELIYYGLWFSPEREALQAFFDRTQEYVTGRVFLVLYKGNVIITGRESPFSLYDRDLVSMDVLGGFDPEDADGFIKIQALRLIRHAMRRGK